MSEALDAVERIADPEARVRAMSQAMAQQVRRQAAWKEQRREVVQRLRDEGVTYRGIAERLSMSLATVQDILRGYSGSGTHRPRKGEGER